MPAWWGGGPRGRSRPEICNRLCRTHTLHSTAGGTMYSRRLLRCTCAHLVVVRAAARPRLRFTIQQYQVV
eukprot:5626737-Prymnesium_polylepis.2